ncbi:eukaryotic translation initiation factor 4E [Blastocystis sp. subtype 4]|uniref:eukaryotic translation initiation factor 4E n=1 Tax=Blastocystis sp. subtype 4 TaxID=944170 RepID=UPI000711D442|nr:eukaryotic translation initiation factor 4E [Blastocystis sp. subtype 4]KNB44930.1 eukaryotic translation initiation factor 4E [Blastocystis sp. subtype 4]|eukprot:XP_014528373.1 eukaryotic translation initiation factor 4E [Blastocystis sp. subtype 4]
MEPEATKENHPLRNYYRFWRVSNIDANTDNYENALEDLGLCRTVEQFWEIYCFLPVIGTGSCDSYYFFKDGIMPLWEDPENKNGGRVTLTLTGTELLPYLWETLLLTTIGEQFNVGKEICGVSVTVKPKKNQSVLCVWNKTATFGRVITQIETVLKTVWNSPPRMRFAYKRNSNAVYSVSMKKEDQEPEATEIKTENRFAGFEDFHV